MIESDNEFFIDVNITGDNIIHVSPKKIVELEGEYGIPNCYKYLEKYDKVIISATTEGYGYWNYTKNIIKHFNKDKLYLIIDGFAPENQFDVLFPGIPRENIFYEPVFSIWFVWNRILSDNGYPKDTVSEGTFPCSSKINDGFRKLHQNNIDKLFDVYSNKREHQFMILNNNFKPGREELITSLSVDFLKNNWVTCNFLEGKDSPVIESSRSYTESLMNANRFEEHQKKYKKISQYVIKEDYAQSKYKVTCECNLPGLPCGCWNNCYEIIWREYYNKAYIQPYFESCAWTDAITEGHYMITEKSLIPFILGNISIPLGIFYVDYLEKMGYQFVKKIGDISINETIDAEDWSGPFNWDEARTDDVKKWNYKLFDKLNKISSLVSLKDIEYLYMSNLDIIDNNRQLVKKHMSDNSIIDKLREWVLK
jgi:hypothetical protein